MDLNIKIYQVSCGDCIGLSFKGSDGLNHHIVVDAGYSGTYGRTLKKFAREIADNNELIDLFVVTHTDGDHIGGVQKFLKDFGANGQEKKGLVKDYWFNWSSSKFAVDDSSDKAQVSWKQGMELREVLHNDEGIPPDRNITNKTKINIGGASITVLSPDEQMFLKFRKKWGKKERKFLKEEVSRPVSGKPKDWSYAIDELIKQPFSEDPSVENGSSIAFLFELNDFKMLLLGDAHPSVVADSLRQLCTERKMKKLKVDYVKLSHHGSRRNTSPGMLDLLDCNQFIISSNGDNSHNLPDKETLARIAAHYHTLNPQKKVHFIFNYKKEDYVFRFKDKIYKGLFRKQEKSDYNIKCSYAQDNNINAYDFKH